MVDRSKLPNAFKFITVAGARAQQLLKGSVPRVSGPSKPARIAQHEVFSGAVREEPPADGGARGEAGARGEKAAR
jgi:DNA-directed RNA polymerase subunit K/omega